MQRHRTTQKKRIVRLVLVIAGLLYAPGYLHLRRNDNFIHRKSFYTDQNQQIVWQHKIGLGEWCGLEAYALYPIYWPARFAESIYWHLQD